MLVVKVMKVDPAQLALYLLSANIKKQVLRVVFVSLPTNTFKIVIFMIFIKNSNLNAIIQLLYYFFIDWWHGIRQTVYDVLTNNTCSIDSNNI